MEQSRWTIPAAIVLTGALVGLAIVYRAGAGAASVSRVLNGEGPEPLSPAASLLPVDWDELEEELVAAGAIDPEKFTGGYRTELNLLWAFGLANENPVLTEGPMMDSRFGGAGPPAGGFASTGGWTLAKGAAMDHYAKHRLLALTAEEQALVERVAKNIYRPCCGNSTYFPDCNHGMAMLGLLELLAARGADEDAMYRAALAMNQKWFPDTYSAIDRYFAMKNMPPAEQNPRLALSYDFSSGEGYQRVLAAVEPLPSQGGGSCGV